MTVASVFLRDHVSHEYLEREEKIAIEIYGNFPWIPLILCYSVYLV